MQSYDVCVIGFGPTGAVAASLLAAKGHSVAVVDRLTGVYDKPRAIALDHEIMRVFQNMGVIDDVLPHVVEYPASEYRGVNGDIIKRLDAAPPPYQQGWAPNYSFTQPPVERILRDHAAAIGGVTLLLGHELQGITQDEEGVMVDLQGPDGPVAARARFLVGADGASSTVRWLTGLTLADLGFDEPWLVVDVLVDEDALDTLPDVNVQYCEPGRPGTHVIGPKNHRRWEIMLNEDEDPKQVMEPDRVWQLLERWVTPHTAKLWRSATYRFHAVVARQWRAGRVFLAGDAAHQQPPFLGQGMCQGVRDADNLSWKLDLVLQGRADTALLDSYGDERREHVTDLTSIIKKLGQFVCERDLEKAKERDAQLIAEMGGKVVTTNRQDIMPRLRAGMLRDTDDAACGTLFPQPRLADGRLLDEALGLGFRLVLTEAVFLSENIKDIPGLKIARLVSHNRPDDGSGNGGAGQVFVEADDITTSWMKAHRAVAALVRPDNYVFGVARSADDIAPLVAACAAWLRP